MSQFTRELLLSSRYQLMFNLQAHIFRMNNYFHVLFWNPHFIWYLQDNYEKTKIRQYFLSNQVLLTYVHTDDNHTKKYKYEW